MQKLFDFIQTISFIYTMLDLKKLNHFSTVAKHGSLSKAASALGLTQPALTLSIRKLEQELDCTLFDRSHGFELTGFGHQLLSTTDKALSQASDIEQEIQLLRLGTKGKLKIACGPSVAEYLIGPAIASLLRQGIDLEVQIDISSINTSTQLLLQREIDFAVVETSAIKDFLEFEITPLPPQEIIFFARKDHPLTKKKKISPKDFFSYPLAASDLPPWAIDWIRENRPDSAKKLGLQIRCAHHNLLIQTVAASDAISAAPKAVIAESMQSGKIAPILFKPASMFNHAGIVFLRDRQLSKSTQRLIDSIKETATMSSSP
ncbi:MAG: LysR family transcriptional regulator [Verrucomicrobiota bacterium]